MEPLLTPLNYGSGLLVDEELLGGVTSNPEKPGTFVAFVIRQSSGEYIVYQEFGALEEALDQMNRVRRPWKFEATKGCGESNCGNNAGGKCKIGGCGKNPSQAASDCQA